MKRSSKRRTDLPRFAELEGDYELLDELGRGATAVVYLARERELGREVAIKVDRTLHVAGQAATARLRREARVLGPLQHPNIVTLYGVRRVGEDGLVLVMQYVRGRTLRAELERAGALSFARVERILADLGRALGYAHAHGVVHAAITPENVLLDAETGAARLAGFGNARTTLEPPPGPAGPPGSPAYMSPEQIEDGELDARSDLYTLALVGYEMLTGVPPWAGESLLGTIYKQKHTPLPPLAQVRPRTPAALRAALEGALAKDPAGRWQRADEFLAALARTTSPGSRARTAAPIPAWPGPPMTAPAETGESSSRPAAEQPGGRAAAGARSAQAPPEQRTSSRAHIPPASAPPPPPRVAAPDDGDERAVDRRRAEALRSRHRAPLIAALLLVIMAGMLVAAALRHASEEAGAAALPALETAPLAVGSDAPAAQPGTAEPAGEPALLYALFGDAQEGLVGDTLAEQLVLRVEDAAGRPAAGALVHFAIREGDGVVDPEVVETDRFGLAGTRWIPRSAGLHEVEATVEKLSSRASFRARALPRSRPRLSATSPTQIRVESGSAEPIAIVVKVADEDGTPIASAPVRFTVRSGRGSITPQEAVTGSDGTLRAEWRLGPEPAQELVATLDDVPEAPLAFRAARQTAQLAVRAGFALGGLHSCALRRDGTAYCWGGNDGGQLGDGASGRRASPAAVASPEPLATLAAGVSHTCGVGVSGALYCWGANTAGQLGDGSAANRASPVRVSTDQRLISVAAGLAHTCALATNGRLLCWGQNTTGQLGDGTRTVRTRPVHAGGTRAYRSVAVGWAHTCALATDGAAYCWGRNASGELGDGSTADRPSAAPVSGGHRFTAIAAGSHHTCGLRTDGAVLCWGQNMHGQLGIGSTEPALVPHATAGAARYTSLALGSVHSCALTRDGAAHCWGRNTYGQLGDGTTQDRAMPGAVQGGLRFAALYASGAHTCGTTAEGREHCWGYNVEGQLGTGTRANQSRPAAIAPRG